MKTYEKYKDSDIEWIGEIPKHWQETKFKTIIDFQEGPGILAKDFHSEGVPLIRISGVKTERVTLDGCNYLDEDLVEKKWKHFKLEVGDIVISCSASTDLVSEVDEFVEDSILYTGLIRLRPKTNDITKDFIKNIVRSNYYQTEIKTQQTGSTIQHYGPVHLKKIKIVLPTVVEQERINNYLDKKTGEIDQLIADKEQLVALYQEEKTAIIDQAVTKGINQNVQLKDSGIEWLGDIPEHWDTVSLKWVSNIYSGGTPSKNKPEYWTNGTIPWLNSGTVNQWDITEPSEYITEEALNNSSAKWIPEKAILMALAGQGKTKGMVAQVQFKCTCNQSMGIIIPNNKIDNRFLLYWLKRNYQNIRNLGGGDKRDGINLEMIGGIPFPFFKVSEQTEIVQHIERESAKINAKIDKAEKYIKLLTEYRTALISEVVTGKIKVID